MLAGGSSCLEDAEPDDAVKDFSLPPHCKRFRIDVVNESFALLSSVLSSLGADDFDDLPLEECLETSNSINEKPLESAKVRSEGKYNHTFRFLRHESPLQPPSKSRTEE